MAKQSGLGDNLYIAGFDLSGDVGSLSRIGGGATALEVTGLDKSAYERIGGVRDGAMEYSGWFNPAPDRLHDRASLLPTTDQILTYCRGTVLGNPAAALVSKQLNYDGTRGNDGALSFAVSAQANAYGLEWGRQLTAGKRTDTGATNGAGVDHAAATAFGLQAYLHVMAFTGTDATIKIQDSADGVAWADLTAGGFTQVTTGTPGAQRIETARNATVRRHLRVATVTTGGFSNLQFAVMAVKNDTTVNF